MTEVLQPFRPDWISAPGETIADLIEEREWTQADLAKRLGYTTKHISLLINGKAPITEETALKLENVLGSSASFWLSREAQYRAKLAQQEAEADLRQWVSWLDELPVKELMAQGVIAKQRIDAKNKPAIVRELLRFFGVASPQEWRSYYGDIEVSFRRTRTDQSDVGAIYAWLRRGEIEAEKLTCQKYNKAKFETAVRAIRQLTVLEPEEFLPQMRQLCGDAGVVFCVVPAIPGAHTSGVARWLNPHKALIQLSLYGKQNDRFWFTFFHEAAHILLHGKKDIFLDNWDGGQEIESEQETEANQWAKEFLIPPKFDSEFSNLRSKKKVISFANTIGIHPGIVVGRLQHEGIIQMGWMNDLKESLARTGMETVTVELEEEVADRVGDSSCSESFQEPRGLSFG
ncbi:MAG TPA: HigA family addiction module antidote protein [Oscillatoriaceae cyanobacterium M33_DOE_052]|uniref:Addiction module antidote protein, HigA family n=1 Tax=Planktothricoides sp. SpSt-374 TaxID=2282167 RepID=A0A7C3VV75_9CYAN|nr:HigA family addiction module antidote protein [Oscillatoriaceae cyanobacterium M33_DOE_052]